MKNDNHYINDAIKGVRDIVAGCIKSTTLAPMADELLAVASSGKMLRVRMMFRVGLVKGVAIDKMQRLAAAVEMLHAASLLHDDVIDGAVLRRGVPTFWIAKGASGAILLGDLLVCQAYRVVNSVESGKFTSVLIDFANEICEAETEQELILKGETPDWPTCVSIARRKTGGLFAFAAYAAGGNDIELSKALMNAGYAVGTAYQLADDILDAYGDQEMAGKTLGNDAVSSKITAATSWRNSNIDPHACISEFLSDSERMLARWPDVASAWGDYLNEDLIPVIDSFVKPFLVQEV